LLDDPTLSNVNFSQLVKIAIHKKTKARGNNDPSNDVDSFTGLLFSIEEFE
jgi:hypothetical protein